MKILKLPRDKLGSVNRKRRGITPYLDTGVHPP